MVTTFTTDWVLNALRKAGDKVKIFTPRAIEGDSQKLASPFHGPYWVVSSKLDGKVYYLRNGEGTPLKYPVSVTHIEPWYDRKELMGDLIDSDALIEENAESDITKLSDDDSNLESDPSTVLDFLTSWDDPDFLYVEEDSELD